MNMESGERWFQRILLGACLLVLALLGLVALYLVQLPAPASNIYFDLQRQASLVYLASGPPSHSWARFWRLCGASSSSRSMSCC